MFANVLGFPRFLYTWYIMLQCSNILTFSKLRWFSHVQPESCQAEAVALGLAPAPEPSEPSEPSKSLEPKSEPKPEPAAPSRRLDLVPPWWQKRMKIEEY